MGLCRSGRWRWAESSQGSGPGPEPGPGSRRCPCASRRPTRVWCPTWRSRSRERRPWRRASAAGSASRCAARRRWRSGAGSSSQGGEGRDAAEPGCPVAPIPSRWSLSGGWPRSPAPAVRLRVCGCWKTWWPVARQRSGRHRQGRRPLRPRPDACSSSSAPAADAEPPDPARWRRCLRGRRTHRWSTRPPSHLRARRCRSAPPRRDECRGRNPEQAIPPRAMPDSPLRRRRPCRGSDGRAGLCRERMRRTPDTRVPH